MFPLMYGTRHFESAVALLWPKVECPLKGISEPVKVDKVTGPRPVRKLCAEITKCCKKPRRLRPLQQIR